MRRYLYISLIVFLFASVLMQPLGKAQAAGSVTGYDMIALINYWRSGYWSNALIEDAALDYCAQATADEMARISAWDHLVYLGYPAASERCAGYGFGGGNTVFVTENWAADSAMTIEMLSGYWGDEDHMLPATMQQYRYVGVGIAEGTGGRVYYVLQAGAIPDEVGSATSVAAGSGVSGQTASTQDSSNYVPPVVTSTPDYDGNIYHVVQNGQTLYTIATYYGVGYETIKFLNPQVGDTLYVGEKLLISKKPTPTITPTRTATVMMPTRTPTLPVTPTIPGPTKTGTPAPTPTKASVFQKLDRQYLGFGLLVLSAVGFFVVFYFFFIRPKFKK